MSHRRLPALNAPLEVHAFYFRQMFAFLLARQLGHAVVKFILGALSIVLMLSVLGLCSLVAYFRV